MSRAIFKTAAAKTQWYEINGKQLVVGRLAAHVAGILSGKHKPIYNPSVDCGDNVVITNAKKVVFTGKKMLQKHYRYHTGFVGGLKVYPVRRMVAEHPERILWKAVYGMLPKNKLRRERMKRLRIFAEETHTHHGLITPLPAHLKIEPKEEEETNLDDLDKVPGYWVEFEQVGPDVVVKSHEQRPDGKKPPRNVLHGVFAKGDARRHATVIAPIEEMEVLKPVANLGKDKKK